MPVSQTLNAPEEFEKAPQIGAPEMLPEYSQ
jgi:hypothetical protein